ncbi:MAG: hypothetical protein KAH22_11450 [Thiotrichaceae bacterium]|nr:hypothetical protein [Thiotrichaceae bacterium]
MNIFESAIKTRKSKLMEYLRNPLHWIGEKVVDVWGEPEAMAEIFLNCLNRDDILLSSQSLYAFNLEGKQISAEVSRAGQVNKNLGLNLSDRPYFNVRPTDGVSLSRSYTNKHTGESCITAMHVVKREGLVIGYIAADFVLFDLQTDHEAPGDRRIWLQAKGDPSIRGTLFMQSRTNSSMDEVLDDVLTIIEELIVQRGIFHAKLHFSSSRSTLWLYDDPYHYRVHVVDELLNDTLHAYPRRPYPKLAAVSPREVKMVLNQFKLLRNVDETIYLRAGSLNIINGMVALNFSCDGSHYIPCEEFLDKGQDFWVGEAGSTAGD